MREDEVEAQGSDQELIIMGDTPDQDRKIKVTNLWDMPGSREDYYMMYGTNDENQVRFYHSDQRMTRQEIADNELVPDDDAGNGPENWDYWGCE